MTSKQTLQAALADPACHDSLKVAIRAFIGKDPVDAACDAAWLAKALRLQLAEVRAAHRAQIMARLEA
jgi:hypothetical protein